MRLSTKIRVCLNSLFLELFPPEYLRGCINMVQKLQVQKLQAEKVSGWIRQIQRERGATAVVGSGTGITSFSRSACTAQQTWTQKSDSYVLTTLI